MLFGRDDLCVAIELILSEARRGVSGSLVLRGEPGIGKTALLDFAAARAEGMRILRCAGVESEAQLPFAGLHQLLRPVLDSLGELPTPQCRALAGAFGLGEVSGDRFMIGAGVLSLLAAAAERSPVLCLVDDAHWLDRATIDAFMFAARRLDREGVALLIATRDQPRGVGSFGLPEAEVGGIDEASAALLLDDVGALIGSAARRQLVFETGGNPLALRELARLGPDRAYRAGPLPLTDRVLDAFGQQLHALPARTRRVLVLAASDDTSDLTTIVRAAAGLDCRLADLAPAESCGLVSVVGRAIVFRHPLVRSAAYHGEPLAERIAAHEALAHTTGDLGRRAWHLAAAATGPDEQIAADLERAAREAEGRGAHGSASMGFARAAELSPSTADAVTRDVLACEAAMAGGQHEWAAHRARRTLVHAHDDASRARLVDVTARSLFVAGVLREAHDHLLTASDLMAPSDPEHAFWTLMRALHAAWAAPTDTGMIGALVDRFDRLDLDPETPLYPVAWLARWATAASLEVDVTTTYPPLDPQLALAHRAARERGPEALAAVASFAFIAARDRVSSSVAATLVRDARNAGQVYALPVGLAQLCLTQVLFGQHREALISGTEAVRIAYDTGQPLWARYANAALAYLAAIQGDESRCHGHVAQVEIRIDEPAGTFAGTTWTEPALALLDLVHGRMREAFDRLARLQESPTRHQSSVVRSIPDLVEAAVHMGREATCVAHFGRFEAWAATMGQPWIDALVARCRGLLGRDDAAEDHFRQAIALHEKDDRTFDRARTMLVYGEWLRRDRRKTEARNLLSTAHALFDTLGAMPWADRAAAELAATGGRLAEPASTDVLARLTPQELQIVQLAARGASNREIAAQLLLSHRTVAYHLYKAYPKLGIGSRTDLPALVLRSRHRRADLGRAEPLDDPIHSDAGVDNGDLELVEPRSTLHATNTYGNR